MVQLQTPKFAFYRGAVRPWGGAVIHVGSEGTYRGINVFEGLKGYWQNDVSMGVVAVPRHYERLKRSARLLHIPFDMTAQQFDHALHAIIEPLCVPGDLVAPRSTSRADSGARVRKSDLYLTAFLTPKGAPAPIRMGVSTWRRAADTMLPARIKTSTNLSSGASRANRRALARLRGHDHAQQSGACGRIRRRLRAVGQGRKGFHTALERRGAGEYHGRYHRGTRERATHSV